MSRPAPQVQRVVRALLSAGLQRNDFRVRCPFDRRAQCYGDVRVNLLISRDRAEALTPRFLEAGLNVCHTILDGEVAVVQVTGESTGTGRLERFDVNEAERRRQDMIARYGV